MIFNISIITATIYSLFSYFIKHNHNILLLILNFLLTQIITILLIFILTFICSLFVNQKKPIKKVSKFYYFIFNIINEFLCDGARIKVKINNKELFDKNKQYLIICNHRSRFDSMIICNEFKNSKIAFISKPSNFKIPLVGNTIHKCGYVSIDRENNRKALESILLASKIMKENNISFGIFPEGKRNKENDGLLEFKNGAFKLAQKNKCPILVLTLKNTDKIQPNFPFKKTIVEMNLLKVIEPKEFENKTTLEIGTEIKNLMLYNLTNQPLLVDIDNQKVIQN